jgi:hypothetical protein
MLSKKKVAKCSDNFCCIHCDYTTEKKFNFDKHILTAKHISAMNVNENVEKCSKSKSNHICSNCNKKYKEYSGLWRHKKKCGIIQCKEDLNDQTKQQQLVDYLMKENSEFKQLMIEQNKYMIDQNKHMMELAKNSGNNNINNSHNTNNTSNNFNLQFFLNETCKDAMNIMEFVDQLQVSVKDLEETGRLGYSEGISKIFINGLKQINISDRPIHCADSKREIVYIKDKNQWNKEDGDKSLLTNAIKHVAHKNMKQIKEWTKVNPEYNDSSSKQNDRYLKIVSNSMNGLTEEETIKNYNKIIKNITKETVIEK